jgi:hypothetical protein
MLSPEASAKSATQWRKKERARRDERPKHFSKNYATRSRVQGGQSERKASCVQAEARACVIVVPAKAGVRKHGPSLSRLGMHASQKASPSQQISCRPRESGDPEHAPSRRI